mmetsp:Transcript_68047/g.120106  ORF Transcript_68047/g.120106 Transcript_68047/m.120106 type:complete len:218 (+) Transcript_68047:438-1091(+)
MELLAAIWLAAKETVKALLPGGVVPNCHLALHWMRSKVVHSNVHVPQIQDLLIGSHGHGAVGMHLGSWSEYASGARLFARACIFVLHAQFTLVLILSDEAVGGLWRLWSSDFHLSAIDYDAALEPFRCTCNAVVHTCHCCRTQSSAFESAFLRSCAHAAHRLPSFALGQATSFLLVVQIILPGSHDLLVSGTISLQNFWIETFIVQVGVIQGEVARV